VQVCLEGKFGDLSNDDVDNTWLVNAFRSEVCEKFEQIHY
jgi:hypothetical protein